MLVIPAIDLMGGKCVRLTRGERDQETVFSDDPVSMAQHWQSLGAKYLHVVDLDGAFDGEPKKIGLIERIVDAIQIPAEVGGGIRSEETVERYLSVGLDRVIVGTRAITSPDWFRGLCERWPGKIVAGIDAKNGKVAVEGWTSVAEKAATDFAKEIAPLGPRAIIFTDVSKDGLLSGPNVEATRKMAESVEVPVIASGGISSVDDVVRVAALPVEGMIIGKALYTGQLSLPDAIRRAEA